MSSNFNRGETIQQLLWIKDPDDDTLIDPATSVKIQVTNPHDEEYQAETDMIRISTGYYGYNIQSASDDPLGRYVVKFTVTDDDDIAIAYDSYILGH